MEPTVLDAGSWGRELEVDGEGAESMDQPLHPIEQRRPGEGCYVTLTQGRRKAFQAMTILKVFP